MKRIFTLLLFFCVGFSILTAQDLQTETPTEQQEPEEFVYKMNQKGDWFVRLGGSVNIPIVPENLRIGMDLNLGFYTFLTENFAVGGDINGTYALTIGDNIYFAVPIMARAMYQFSVKNFEIPVSLGTGVAIQTYLERYYFGLIINPEVGVYYRFMAGWSAGIHCGVNILPQWYENKEYNRTGYIMDTGVSVRYHF